MDDQTTVEVETAQLSTLLARVERGDTVVITRAGVPVARLIPAELGSERTLGFLPGVDTSAAFFDPLPDDELSAWGTR